MMKSKGVLKRELGATAGGLDRVGSEEAAGADPIRRRIARSLSPLSRPGSGKLPWKHR